MLKAFRFALRAKPAQERQLRRYVGACRWAWNAALAEQQARQERREKYAGFAQMCKWLTSWRNAPWTKPSSASSGTRRRELGRRGLDPVNARVLLPRLGWLRLRQSREVQGELRNPTVTRQGNRWFVSIQTRSTTVLPAAGVEPTLGVDLGIAAFAATSEGASIAPLNPLKRQQRRLRRYQRAVARKKNGGRNRKTAVRRLAALHRRIACRRNDWLHKLTTELADAHPVIAIEDLRMAAMSATAEGTAAKPGKNVRGKAGLNKAILDQGWGQFTRLLEYKVAARGGELGKVNPAYSSRTCRVCGHRSADNRKSQALFFCVACGHAEHADVHASKNILTAGRAAWAVRTAEGRASGQPEAAACEEDVRHLPCASDTGAASKARGLAPGTGAGTHRNGPAWASPMRGVVGVPVRPGGEDVN